MGMYTQLVFTCELKEDTPEYILDTIEKLVNNEEITDAPAHEFFSCSRYEMLCNGDSAYFGGATVSKFNRKYRELTIVSNLKNYDGEIQKFISWILPYVDYGAGGRDLLGYVIYEESDMPTLIYMDKLKSGFDSHREHWDIEEAPVLPQEGSHD